MPIEFSTWLRSHQDRVLWRVLGGSHAYGLATAHSDVDERGVFVIPVPDLLSVDDVQEHVQDERGDIVFTGLRKFAQLLCAANPGALEVLHAPPDTVRFRHRAFEPLLANRALFVTRKCIDTFMGYARTQVARARGQNKWVHNPQPEAPPRREDFCYVILGPWPGEACSAGTQPLRPRRLADAGIDLREFHCAALEHVPRTYRLYHYGPGARGVFRDGNLVCESIPIDDEAPRLRGLLVCDEESYERSKRDHANYWQWRAQRNEARWRSQEAGETDYDAKNMMHTFRLLASARAILRDGAPQVHFDGAQRDELLRIRAGAFAYDELVARADAMVAELEMLASSCGLPERADPGEVDALLREVTGRWEQGRA